MSRQDLSSQEEYWAALMRRSDAKAQSTEQMLASWPWKKTSSTTAESSHAQPELDIWLARNITGSINELRKYKQYLIGDES